MGSDQRLYSSAVHTADTYIDLRGAKYRSDTYQGMCESYTHIPLHSVPVHKLAVDEISLIAMCMGVTTY